MTETTTGGDAALSVDEACARLGGLRRSKFYSLIRTGELKALKLGSRTVIRASEIDRFLTELPSIEPTEVA